jgi:hypothetical protein
LQIHSYFRYNERKGFYCLQQNCLGAGKGRNYENMDEVTERTLHQYYRHSNIKLHQLLRDIGYDVPKWLQKSLMFSKPEEEN